MDSMNKLFDDIRFYKDLVDDVELSKFLKCSLSLVTAIRNGHKGLTAERRLFIKNACPEIHPNQIIEAKYGVPYVFHEGLFFSCKRCGLVYDKRVVYEESLICICERGLK
jgi:hypothetical protein